jgi:hypothetical protein
VKGHQQASNIFQIKIKLLPEISDIFVFLEGITPFIGLTALIIA